MKTNGASGSARRVASSRLSVPLALTREVGLRVAGRPVVRRLRGGVDDQLDAAGARARTAASTPSASRMSRSARAELVGKRSASCSVIGAVDASGPKNCGAHVVLDPDHVVAGPTKWRTRLGADQAAGSGDDRGGHWRASTSRERGHDGASCSRDPASDVRRASRAALAARAPVGPLEQPRGSRRCRPDVARAVGSPRRRPAPRCRSARGTARSSRAATASTRGRRRR